MGQRTGKTALAAGAGRNNGKAISIAFAREGAHLILVARRVGGGVQTESGVPSYSGVIPAALITLA